MTEPLVTAANVAAGARSALATACGVVTNARDAP
jgi:hypothetical protein